MKQKGMWGALRSVLRCEGLISKHWGEDEDLSREAEVRFVLEKSLWERGTQVLEGDQRSEGQSRRDRAA